MALEFLGNFVGRTLDSLRRFRSADPAVPAEAFQHSGKPIFDAAEIDCWEKFKAEMALEELERWQKMNLIESRRETVLCPSCGRGMLRGSCSACDQPTR